MKILLRLCALAIALVGVIPETALGLSATWSSSSDVPITAGSYTATGNAISFTLNYVPITGTNLTVVNNTGLGFISGRFSNLAQGQLVSLSYGGITCNFVATYYGGTGNDLVLQWANVHPVAWGRNSGGQLGNNSLTTSLVPTAVSMTGVLSGKTVVAVLASDLEIGHSLALCTDGTLAAWGDNRYGQLGNNSTANSLVPSLVTTTGILSGKTIVAAAAGEPCRPIGE